ncbi:MFS transporter [Subtercola sp. RTI3]|uniref:MFS transporter n=1 Tax=Subtercola sp. RTI3 TaxID=3048639 RepID=UPI002B23B3D5|nr:MFS transporter [Subtercola sp. RTI3]MEA9984934.1 MFS transporter [Subtercola sp. RTI3]
MSQTSPAATAASSRRWLTLAIVALAQLMVVLDATVVNIALPAAQADLGFSNGDRQWVVTAYSLAFGSLLLLGGRVSDLIGRKPTFIIGLIGFAAASALGGAADSFGTLVAARALQGLFGALLAPTALAVLTTTFTIPKERSRAFGVFGAIAGAGGAVGLLLGGYLTQDFSWRWNLYINVFFAIIAVIGAIIFVPTIKRTTERPKLDIPGTIMVSAALFSLVYGFSNAETNGWGDFFTWGLLVASGILFIAFVLWQRRAQHPLLPLAIILNRNRGAAYLSVFIAGSGMFAVFLFLTYFLQTSLNFSPITTGLSFLPMIACLVLAAQLGTNIFVPRFGPKVMVPTGMLMASAALLWMTRLDLSSTYAANILPPLMLMGLAMGTIMPAAMQTATLGVDRQFAGVASAMVNTSQQVGGSISTALLNTLVATAVTNYIASNLPASPAVAAQAAVNGYALAYACASGLFFAGAVMAALLFKRKATVQATAHAAHAQAEKHAENDRIAEAAAV